MYLSRIALDAQRRETLRALGSPHILHAAVEQSFAGSRKRNLWRIDWLGEDCYLLVLSPEQPNFLKMSERFGYSKSKPQWETRDYDPFLARLNVGQVWQFRLQANPTRSSAKEKDDESGRGKVFAHVTEEQQKQWLLARADACGFVITPDSLGIVGTKWYKFPKGETGKNGVTLRTVTFEGMLTISDLERFRQTMMSGIGRAKAYGCGLLTIARPRSNDD